jgi:hypothetical protein
MSDSQEACETTTEWGVRWESDHFYLDPILRDDEDSARKLARNYAAQGATLVSRQVTRGPWTEVTV